MGTIVGEPSREVVDVIIGAYPISDAVIGTRVPDALGWCVGRSRDLRHDCWLVGTGERRKDRAKIIRFDSVVDVGGTRLAPADALTKKLLVLAWLAGTLQHRRIGRRRLLDLACVFDWLVRHRLSIGVARVQDLQPRHFRDFMKRAEAGGAAADLVPIGRRLGGAPATAAGGASPPTAGTGVGNATCVQAMPGRVALARQLGVTTQSLSRRLGPRRQAEHQTFPTDADYLSRPGAYPRARRPRMNHYRLRGLLEVWKDIRVLSIRGVLAHDPLLFDPLEGTTASKLAKLRGAPSSGSDAVAPTALFPWLLQAAVVVAEWAAPTIAAVETCRSEGLGNPRSNPAWAKSRRTELSIGLDAGLPDGMPGLWLAWHKPYKVDIGGRRNLAQAVYHLMTACLVLIAAFAACGVDDVLDLTPDSLVEPSPGLFELVVRRDPLLRPQRVVPLPTIAATAFRVLLRLTLATREAEGGTSLFRIA
jgi:hypothetical protein